jgi:hypothetical protein
MRLVFGVLAYAGALAFLGASRPEMATFLTTHGLA